MSTPEVAPPPAQVEPIIITAEYDDAGAPIPGTLRMATTPPLSAIADTVLQTLDPAWRDPAEPDVLILPGGHRYLLGEHYADTAITLLHRLPGDTEAGPG